MTADRAPKQFSWRPQHQQSLDSQSSITLFTKFANTRAGEDSTNLTTTHPDGPGDDPPVFDSPQHTPDAPGPGKFTAMMPSYSTSDILQAMAEEEREVESATLSRPKPKPRPRVARKSESNTKAAALDTEVTLKTLTDSNRKSMLVRSTSVDGFRPEDLAPPPAEVPVEAATLSRPKPKPRPRGRKSESSAKAEEVAGGKESQKEAPPTSTPPTVEEDLTAVPEVTGQASEAAAATGDQTSGETEETDFVMV